MIGKKKPPENNKSYNELKEENNENEIKIESLNNIIDKLQNQNNNLSQEDKIEEKISKLKNVIYSTKEKWNQIYNDIIALENEIKDIKNQMNTNFENFRKIYIEEFKKNLQKYYKEKLKIDFKNINNNLEEKMKERIENIDVQYKKQLEKLNKKDKDNEIENNIQNQNEIKKNYSFECLNSKELNKTISRSDNELKLKIVLKNNGNLPWPENTILFFNRYSLFSGNQYKLNPQKPGEVMSYDIKLESLQYAKLGESPIILEVFIGKDSIGKEIKAKMIVKE